jgi:hypothetical protein
MGGNSVARFRFYGGVFVIAAATLMLQIIETRIISVTSWYHLAFFVISTAMFGLTAGAVWVYLWCRDLPPRELCARLTIHSLGFAISTVLALLMQMTIVTTSSSTSLTTLFAWTELAICLAVPFFFSGVVVSLALTRSPYPIGWVYAADLIGAAVGCLGVLLVLELTSGPSAVLWTGVLGAAAALLFAGSDPRGEIIPVTSFADTLFRRRWLVFAGLLLLSGTNEVTDLGLRPLFVKDRLERADSFVFEGWNSFSRVTVERSSEGPAMLWGPSPRMPEHRIEQQWMTLDGSAGTSMYRFNGNLEDLAFLRYDVTNLAYALPGLKTGAVIGVGGGKDVLSARLFGVEQVVGIEINPILVNLLRHRFADYTALARIPGVSLAVDEARSWLARSARSFHVIQMSLIDTWAATGAGAFTLSENGLYTTEAWRIFLRRLEPEGVFTVSRWYAPGEVNETGRMVSLAVATLLDLGVTAPEQHLYLAATDNVATLIVSRSRFLPTALDALDNSVRAREFMTLLSPRQSPSSATLGKIIAAREQAALYAATRHHHLDLTAPTDARPFFFNQLRFDRLLEASNFTQLWRPGVYGGNLVATLTLMTLILVSAGLVLATIVLPLRSTVVDTGWMLAAAGTAYFLLIGVGFMMTEIALLQRISVFLGHPVYALSIVLFSLILTTGLGSLASERVVLSTAPRLAVWSIATAAYIFLLPYWLPQGLLTLDSAPLVQRAAFSVLVLAPAGFLLGFGFPTGMRMVSAIDPRPMPWFWGINGAGGVMAASVAVLVSIALSIDLSLQIGAACYMLLLGPALLLQQVPKSSEQTRPPEQRLGSAKS